MSRWSRMCKNASWILVGFSLALLLGTGLAVAGPFPEQDIRVVLMPLKFMFDGIQKSPPTDQTAFVYNGRTYVPLRFVGEALGKNVEYDANSLTVYVGRRPDKPYQPGTLIDYSNPFNQEWPKDLGASGNLQWKYQQSGYKTTMGEDMPNSVVLTASCGQSMFDPAGNCPGDPWWRQDYVLNGQYQKLSGVLFVPDFFLAKAGDRLVGQIWIADDQGKWIYESPILNASTMDPKLPFSVNVTGLPKVTMYLQVYTWTEKDGKKIWQSPEVDGKRITKLGLSNFGLD